MAASANAGYAGQRPARKRQRPQRRQLFCPAHPDQRISGTGKKYFLHLLSVEELQQRGMSSKRARLVIQAYPVLVLSQEWLEQLYCPSCGQSRWHHVRREDDESFSLRWAPRELWQQVAHVDPVQANPSVSEYTRHQARRLSHKRLDNKLYFDC